MERRDSTPCAEPIARCGTGRRGCKALREDRRVTFTRTIENLVLVLVLLFVLFRLSFDLELAQRQRHDDALRHLAEERALASIQREHGHVAFYVSHRQQARGQQKRH